MRRLAQPIAGDAFHGGFALALGEGQSEVEAMRRLPVFNIAAVDTVGATRSKTFFAKLGYSFNPKFTDATAACMVISKDINAMLLTEPKFKEFTDKPIVNAKEATEVLVCLSQESKAKVNEIVGFPI